MSGRAATIPVRLIENGDAITMHFEDDRFPPLWFNSKTRPVAHAKLRAILTEMQADVDDEREARAS
jgi:hypothetical protein